MNIALFYLVFTLSTLAMEIVAGRHRGIYSRADWKVNLLTIGLGMAVMRPLVSVVLTLMFGVLLPEQRNALADVPVWFGFLVTLLVSEFIFYWVHRWSHEGAGPRGQRWLWKLHRTHHSAKYMNVVVTNRINLFWMVIQPNAWVIAVALFLGQTAAATGVAVILYAWNVITHSSYRWDDAVRCHPWFGPAFRLLEHVVVTPGIHHTHHGYGKDGANYRNFGVFLSLYDTLFGTLHIPQGRPWRYGLPGSNPHWAEEVFYPLVQRLDPNDIARSEKSK